MNKKLEAYKKFIRDKKVAVLGIGISNTPLIKYLAGSGVDVTAFDKACEKELQPALSRLEGLNVRYILGEVYLSHLTGFDIIFKTPVIRYDIPELLKAREEGAIVTSEMEVFFDLCPAKIFAVTGSDGKTTTTTLIYNILKEEGYKCWLGGNIGIPLLSMIDEISETDMVVLELSSFQLHTMKKSPHTALITNISPNHLDIHKSMEEYTEAKKNIFRFQLAEDLLILNYDNLPARELASEAKSRVVFFSRREQLKYGMILKEGRLVFRNNGNMFGASKSEDIDVCGESDILIPGDHNVENFLAASAAVMEYVRPEAISKVAKSFKGVEHRIELVRELHGIKFYNSSIDSSPNRTIAALNTFKQKVILIAGGKDKKIPYDELGSVMIDKVKCLILIGQTAPVIESVFVKAREASDSGWDIDVIRCASLNEAVNKAYSCASEGDIILLSPASTSFDMFSNFEDRGNKFKEIVNSIK